MTDQPTKVKRYALLPSGLLPYGPDLPSNFVATADFERMDAARVEAEYSQDSWRRVAERCESEKQTAKRECHELEAERDEWKGSYRRMAGYKADRDEHITELKRLLRKVKEEMQATLDSCECVEPTDPMLVLVADIDVAIGEKP